MAERNTDRPTSGVASGRRSQSDAIRATERESLAEPDGRATVPVAASVLLGLLALCLILAAPGAASTGGQSSGAAQDAPGSCEPPVDLRETAHDRLSELKDLDEDEYVTVPDETIGAIERQVASGDSAYDLRNYCDAREAYEAAVDQSAPALRGAYRDGAARYLNASAGMVATERGDANPDPDVADLAERIEQRRADLAAASSVARLREAYDDASRLHAEVRDRLPTDPHERVVEAVFERPVVAGFAGLMAALAGIEGILLWWWTRSGQQGTVPITR